MVWRIAMKFAYRPQKFRIFKISKLATGRHLEIWKIIISRQRFDRFSRHLPRWRTLTSRPNRQLKFGFLIEDYSGRHLSSSVQYVNMSKPMSTFLVRMQNLSLQLLTCLHGSKMPFSEYNFFDVFTHYCTDPDVTWGNGRGALQLCNIGRIGNRCMGFVAVTT